MKIDNSNITRPVLGSSISAREKLLGAGHYTILIASLWKNTLMDSTSSSSSNL